jgi:hypothetical protein
MKALQSNVISIVTEMIGGGAPIPLTGVDTHKPAFFFSRIRAEVKDLMLRLQGR